MEMSESCQLCFKTTLNRVPAINHLWSYFYHQNVRESFITPISVDGNDTEPKFTFTMSVSGESSEDQTLEETVPICENCSKELTTLDQLHRDLEATKKLIESQVNRINHICTNTENKLPCKVPPLQMSIAGSTAGKENISQTLKFLDSLCQGIKTPSATPNPTFEPVVDGPIKSVEIIEAEQVAAATVDLRKDHSSINDEGHPTPKALESEVLHQFPVMPVEVENDNTDPEEAKANMYAETGKDPVPYELVIPETIIGVVMLSLYWGYFPPDPRMCQGYMGWNIKVCGLSKKEQELISVSFQDKQIIFRNEEHTISWRIKRHIAQRLLTVEAMKQDKDDIPLEIVTKYIGKLRTMGYTKVICAPSTINSDQYSVWKLSSLENSGRDANVSDLKKEDADVFD